MKSHHCRLRGGGRATGLGRILVFQGSRSSPRRRTRWARRPRILLGATVDGSIGLMRGLPEKLVESGWEVHLVASPGPNLESYSGSDHIFAHAIWIERGPAPLGDFKVLLKLLRLMTSVRPDVVSVGTPKVGLLGTLAALAVPGAKRVYLLRGLRLETSRGLGRWLLWLAEAVTMRAATQVLAISPSLRDRAIEERLVSSSRILVVGPGSSNGVDLERYSASFEESAASHRSRALLLDLVPGVPVVGYVGRVCTDKGIGVLLEASRLLHERHIQHQLLVVGAPEGSWKTAFPIAVEAHPVRVVATGGVRNVHDYYPLMSVFAFPTYREGFGNVSVEAQACGVPVVATDATGARDTLQVGVGGLMVPVGDAEALAEALAEVLTGTVTFDQEQMIKGVHRYERSAVQDHYVRHYAGLLGKNAAREHY